MEISVSILNSLDRIKDTIILNNTSCDYLHIDVMDGNFVPDTQFTLEEIKNLISNSSKKIDIHLMVDDPYSYASVIAPYSDWYFFHYEAVKDPFRTLQMLRRDYPNLKIGLTFNLMTDTSTIDSILQNFKDYIDGVMFMGISPGVLGTKSMPKIVENKLNFVNTCHPWCRTFVDGSVSWDTLKPYKDVGAYTVVCGTSTMYKDAPFGDTRKKKTIENIGKIKNLIQ